MATGKRHTKERPGQSYSKTKGGSARLLRCAEVKNLPHLSGQDRRRDWLL